VEEAKVPWILEHDILHAITDYEVGMEAKFRHILGKITTIIHHLPFLEGTNRSIYRPSRCVHA